MKTKSKISHSCTLICLLLLINSCSKKSPEPELIYIPGEIELWTKDDTSIEKTFEFINEFGLPIERLAGSVRYYSTLPNDSLTYVLDYLKSKPYTNNGKTFTTAFISGAGVPRIGVSPQLFNMNSIDNQKDWIDTIQKLKLIPGTASSTDSFRLFITVTIGSENAWVKKLEKHDIVELIYQSYRYDKF